MPLGLISWSLLGRAAPWAALTVAGLVIWGLAGRLEGARTRLAAAEGVIKRHEEDARRNRQAVQQLADTLARTEAKVITITEKVYAAPVTRDCAQSPSMRAASDGLRELFRDGQADDRRQPAPTVR